MITATRTPLGERHQPSSKPGPLKAGSSDPALVINNEKQALFRADTKKNPGRVSARAHFASFNFTSALIWGLGSSALAAFASGGMRGKGARLRAGRGVNPQRCGLFARDA
jgi:hypothetical protein